MAPSDPSPEPSPTTGDRTDASCAEKHPLVREVECQRLRGHPGAHRAWLESRRSEVSFEWPRQERLEDPPAR